MNKPTWNRKSNKPKFNDEKILRRVVDLVKAKTKLSDIEKQTGVPVKAIKNKMMLLGHSLRGLS